MRRDVGGQASARTDSFAGELRAFGWDRRLPRVAFPDGDLLLTGWTS